MRIDLISIFRFLATVVSGLILFAGAAWGTAALYYTGHRAFAILFGIIGLISIVALVLRVRIWSVVSIVTFLVAFGILLAWWSTIKPSNSRDWQPDVARIATSTIEGDLVTIRDIRYLDYRTETDYTVRYYDKTYDLRELNSLDLISVYWMGPAIAHLFVSFGFGDKDYLAISAELRKEKGESYSAITGLFKQFELYYVVADERDVIRVRTDFRNPQEQVFLYRTRVPPENVRKLLLDYLKSINHLATEPEFYNTLTSNCTTNIFLHARAFPNRVHYNWKLLMSGYTPEYMYELGALDTSLPFEELKRRSYVNDRAHAAGDSPDFSQLIRRDLPMPR